MENVHIGVPCVLLMLQSTEYNLWNIHLLLPVGCKYSLGLVVTGKPVDSALNQNQTELGILILQNKSGSCEAKL